MPLRVVFALNCLLAFGLLFLIGINTSGRSVSADLRDGTESERHNDALQGQIDELRTRFSALDATVSRISLNDPPVGTVAGYLGALPVDEGDRARWEKSTGWIACDGRSIADLPEYAQLREVLGSDHIPDLRSSFLRGIDFPSGGKLAAIDSDGTRSPGSRQAYATARPVTSNFVTTTEPGHFHTGLWHAPPDNINPQTGWTAHGNWAHAWRSDGPGANADQKYRNSPLGPLPALSGFREMQRMPESKAGEHSHAITVGGDLETRPVNNAAFWLVKATSRNWVP